MRVNIYSQELTDEVEIISKNGVNEEGEAETFYGVRMMLHSSPLLPYGRDADDRSAITLWLPKSMSQRQYLANTLHEMAQLVERTIP